MLLGLSVMTALPAFAQKPVYLDTGKPIEERVKDALNRMTLEEKVKMIHAQSKFSSAGVPRLGIPEVWATDGPHGIRPEVLWDEWDQAGWTNDSCIAYPALTCLVASPAAGSGADLEVSLVTDQRSESHYLFAAGDQVYDLWFSDPNPLPSYDVSGTVRSFALQSK